MHSVASRLSSVHCRSTSPSDRLMCPQVEEEEESKNFFQTQSRKKYFERNKKLSTRVQISDLLT